MGSMHFVENPLISHHQQNVPSQLLLQGAKFHSHCLSQFDGSADWGHWVLRLDLSLVSTVFLIQRCYLTGVFLCVFLCSYVEALMYLIYSYQYNRELLLKGLYRGHDEELLGYHRRECLLVRRFPSVSPFVPFGILPQSKDIIFSLKPACEVVHPSDPLLLFVTPFPLYQTSVTKVTQQKLTKLDVSPLSYELGFYNQIAFTEILLWLASSPQKIPQKVFFFFFLSDTDWWKSFQRRDVSLFSFLPHKLAYAPVLLVRARVFFFFPQPDPFRSQNLFSLSPSLSAAAALGNLTPALCS